MIKKIGLMMLVGLIVGVCPVEAYIGKVEGSLTPLTGNYKVGDKFSTKVVLAAGTGKISAAYLNLTVDTSKLKVSKVEVNREKFSGVYMEKEAEGVVSLYGTSSRSAAELPTGMVEVGTVSFEVVATGTVSVNLKNSEVVGPGTGSDVNYEMVWKPSSFVLSGVDTGGLLKFKTTFAGVMSGAKCATNWPVSITVLKNGTNHSFGNVELIAEGEIGGRQVYVGQVRVPGLVNNDKIAVFIKGPRHLQTKYGVNGQDGFYNKAGGEIIWQEGLVLDLTKYANLAGDVTGAAGVQDGSVDGMDFVYVKGEVVKRLDGNNMKADLNGNCKLESLDLTQLMLAIKDRQEQLY